MSPKQRPSPESVEEALRNAAHHARNALAELVAASRSVLDAVSLVATNDSVSANPTLASVARLLDELEAHVASPTRGASDAEPLLKALSEALGAEIARWEKRATHDADARAVLRAFIGLREVLWELGVRPGGSSAPPASPASAEATEAHPQKKRNPNVTSAQPDATHSSSGPRVQRVRVRG